MIKRQKIEYIQTYALIVCYKVIVKIKCLKQFCSFHIYYKYNIIIKVLNTMLKSVKIYIFKILYSINIYKILLIVCQHRLIDKQM